MVEKSVFKVHDASLIIHAPIQVFRAQNIKYSLKISTHTCALNKKCLVEWQIIEEC